MVFTQSVRQTENDLERGFVKPWLNNWPRVFVFTKSVLCQVGFEYRSRI